MSSLLVLDASPIINALGCGAPERILAPFDGKCVVEENTLKEVIRNPFDMKHAGPVLEGLIDRNYLKVVRLGDVGYESYIELVAASASDALGRGEAAALAYAQEVGAVIVLDDRKARRIGCERFPACKQYSSLTLFRHAAETSGMTLNQIIPLVSLAFEKARMHVLPEDRLWLDELGISHVDKSLKKTQRGSQRRPVRAGTSRN